MPLIGKRGLPLSDRPRIVAVARDGQNRKTPLTLTRSCTRLRFRPFNHLKINPHRDGAGDLFVAAALPEFTGARIIIGHHDNDALDFGPTQTPQAFIQQTLTESASL